MGTALAESARQRGSTPFMALLAVFFAVLHRWSGLEDLMVTVPVSKRTRPELAGLLGLLVDTLPLRIQCDADPRYDTLRSKAPTSELQSLMRISYAVFCLIKKNT